MWELTQRQVLLALAVLSLAAVAPLALTPYPSLDDYFHHLARAHILSRDAAGALDQYYTIEWNILPNLAMDVIVPPLAGLIPLEVAGRLFVGLSLVLIVSGTMALHAALYGRVSWWPLVVCLILWNRSFLYGLVNYIFTLGLMLWALAAWVHWRERAAAFRLPVFAAIATVLFFGHMLAMGIYAVVVVGYELARWWDRPPHKAEAAGDAAVALGQFALPAAFLLLTSPTGEYAGAVAYVDDWFRHKLRGFHHLFLNYYIWLDRLTFLAVTLAVLIALLTRRIVVHRQMRLGLALGLAIYLLMPDTLFDAGAASYRLPVAIACVFFAASAPMRLPWPRAIAAALLVLFLVRMGLIAERYVEFDRIYRDYVATIREAVPEGAAMLTVANRMPDYHREFHQPQLIYLGALAIIERSVFDPGFATFAHPGKQPVQLQPEQQRLVEELDRRLMDVPDVRRLARTPPLDLVLPNGLAHADAPPSFLQAFDYLLLLYADDRVNPAPDHLEPVEIGAYYHLYRVRDPGEG
jgi:hypothetical protein